jgi:spoIIIJ-associated protein
MATIKMTGRTLDEAMKAAAAVLGTTVDQIGYSVVKEGKAGMLGGMIGGEEFEIEAYLMEKPGASAKEMLQTIVDLMGFMALVYVLDETNDSVSLEIKGDDLGRLIGKEGKAIESFQTLLFAMLKNKLKRRIRVSLEIAGYKEKANNKILTLASKLAENVRSSGNPESLPPMNAYDRRLVHEMLSNDPNLSTHSEGEGKERHLIISLKSE